MTHSSLFFDVHCTFILAQLRTTGIVRLTVTTRPRGHGSTTA
jgi:hypothetical protein